MGEQWVKTIPQQDGSQGFPSWGEDSTDLAGGICLLPSSASPGPPKETWGPQGDISRFYNFWFDRQKLQRDVSPLCDWGVRGAESVLENSQREDQIDKRFWKGWDCGLIHQSRSLNLSPDSSFTGARSCLGGTWVEVGKGVISESVGREWAGWSNHPAKQAPPDA